LNQAEEMRSQRNRPVAAVAEATRATSHSHTTAVERRDDCSTVYQSAPGLTLGIRRGGDPVFRLEVVRLTEASVASTSVFGK
jgi:hypothetical protein